MWRYCRWDFLFPFSCSAFFDCQMCPQNTVNSLVLTCWKLAKNQKQYPIFYPDSNPLSNSLNFHLIKNFFYSASRFFHFSWCKQYLFCYSNLTLWMKSNPELPHVLQLLSKIQQFDHAEQLGVIQFPLTSMTRNFHSVLLCSQLWTIWVHYHQWRGLASHHHHHTGSTA